MNASFPVAGVMVVMSVALVMALVMMIAAHLPYMFRDKTRFNCTADWTPAPDNPQKCPSLTCLTPYDHRLIEPYLEEGEKLEGFTRGFFVPARPVDWKLGSGLEKLPLLIAATSQRMLLFEVTLLTVHRYCFIPYDELAYFQPPKAQLLGTSGRMKFGLKSGYEYQMGFLGPLFNDEGMRQEQNMAAYFREVASRAGLAPEPAQSSERAAA
jgi:hypothetical protein